ncbi:MAG: hypothetical protein GYB58_18785 [Gammaproteobacteria bacterium]|nr:hypothetical protein [Gammaproteobacteria bacterium]
MTSEVVIFNNQGIALAADSAVTIGHQKTYNSAIKLFSLSVKEPIGIMVFGNANILSIPWEVLIKSYRSVLSDKSYDNLSEYATDFINYISNCGFFSEESQVDFLTRNLRGYYSSLLDTFFIEIHQIFESDGEIDLNTTENVFSKVVDEFLLDANHREFCSKFDIKSKRRSKASVRNVAESTISKVFENLPISKKTREKLIDLAALLMIKFMFSNKDLSGLVIAGYGKKEIFPQVATYQIAGMYDSKLRYYLDEEKTYCENNDGSSAILAFADYQMVDTFMKGTNDELLGFVFEYIRNTLEGMPELISKIYKTRSLKPNEKYLEAVLEIVKNCFRSIQSHTDMKHTSPVMSMVAALPKDELAAMAESLVNLTAFKRKVTHVIESVGGPIDVAVISKGDGMVWVKRKHYFPPELNHSYFENYGK